MKILRKPRKSSYVRQHGINAFYDLGHAAQGLLLRPKVEPLKRALAGKRAWIILACAPSRPLTCSGLPFQYDESNGLRSSTRSPTGSEVWTTSSSTPCRTTPRTTSSTRSTSGCPLRAISLGEDTGRPAGGGKMPTLKNVAFTQIHLVSRHFVAG